MLVVAAGDARLATAGTGDVLSGIIGALLADRARRRSTPPRAGAVAARRGRPALGPAPSGSSPATSLDALPAVLERA